VSDVTVTIQTDAHGMEFSPCADHVTALPILTSNYTFLLHPTQSRQGQQVLVVDPGEADPVQAWLEGRGLDLAAVLQTHHHRDHIGGTPQLKHRWPKARVYAAARDRKRIPFQDHSLRGGERLHLLGREVTVLAVPGHTCAHLAYHVLPLRRDGSHQVCAGEAGGLGEAGELFCGDTLFVGGCGRLFEGTAEQMHASLTRLVQLDPRTRIWCAHEYTLSNYRWAVDERPGDPLIRERLA